MSAKTNLAGVFLGVLGALMIYISFSFYGAFIQPLSFILLLLIGAAFFVAGISILRRSGRSVKLSIVGILWPVFGVISLLGFLGLVLVNLLLEAGLQILASTVFSLIIGIAFLAAGVGLLMKKKWSFKLGIAVPAVDILVSIAFSAWALAMPGTLPAGFQELMASGIAGSIVLAVVELAGIALVLKSRNELVK